MPRAGADWLTADVMDALLGERTPASSAAALQLFQQRAGKW